jgi:hypothetical protein
VLVVQLRGERDRARGDLPERPFTARAVAPAGLPAPAPRPRRRSWPLRRAVSQARAQVGAIGFRCKLTNESTRAILKPWENLKLWP